jgi:virginiamycin A acetyltransferase
MMKLSDKLYMFQASGLEDTHVATTEVLAQIGIANAKNLKNALFEECVNISSQILSQNLTTFIGAYSYMNEGGYIRNNVFIGRYCSIGRRVSIGAGSHPMTGLSTHPSLVYGEGTPYTESQVAALGRSRKRTANTIIHNDVWIGDGVVVIPGVTIGTGAIIGANSVVTSDVQPYAIIGGIPSRVIRYRFPHEIATQLLETEWWEYPHLVMKHLPRRNIFEFIEAILKAKNLGLISENRMTYRLRTE